MDFFVFGGFIFCNFKVFFGLVDFFVDFLRFLDF